MNKLSKKVIIYLVYKLKVIYLLQFLFKKYPYIESTLAKMQNEINRYDKVQQKREFYDKLFDEIKIELEKQN